jgi:citrate synthase
MEQLLESAEAARRLGVKVSTLYAYVSRGAIVPVRSPDGRRSLFALEDVERLARRGRGGRQVETRLATVTTSVTQLRDDGPWYRGRAAVELARTATFEEVAASLWRHDPGEWTPAPLGPPPESGPLRPHDRLAWTTVELGARDATRSDLRPEAVARVAARLVTSMVASLEPPSMPGTAPPTVAGSLAAALLGRRPVPAVTRAVDAALVLLADHELATSTLAVRVAASTRASVYDAVLAGLGTMAGPLHGGASGQAYRLLADAEARGAARAVDDALRWHGRLPGFGHTVYRRGDPRAGVLFEMLEALDSAPAGQGAAEARRLEVDALGQVVELARDHGLPEPNVDLALAALARALGATSDAGEVIFTVARTAGWVAHYMEELDQPPLRFRVRAVYAADR